MITLEEFQTGIADLKSTKDLIKYCSEKYSECQTGEHRIFVGLVEDTYRNKMYELFNAERAERIQNRENSQNQ